MSKWDKNLEDSRSGGKANTCFAEYHAHKIFPHVAIAPTLDRGDVDAGDLFQKRMNLPEEASSYEMDQFDPWQARHKKYRETDPDDPKRNAAFAISAEERSLRRAGEIFFQTFEKK